MEHLPPPAASEEFSCCCSFRELGGETAPAGAGAPRERWGLTLGGG